MGLPKSQLNVTCKDVVTGKLSFKDSAEYKMYSRHNASSDKLVSGAISSSMVNSK